MRFFSPISSGSNLGPIDARLLSRVEDAARELASEHAEGVLIPVDLVTASASGLDPHVSPAAADFQAGRIARTRGLPEERVRQLVRERTEGRTLGIFGEPRVNVLRLNLALDDASHPMTEGCFEPSPRAGVVSRPRSPRC